MNDLFLYCKQSLTILPPNIRSSEESTKEQKEIFCLINEKFSCGIPNNYQHLFLCFLWPLD